MTGLLICAAGAGAIYVCILFALRGAWLAFHLALIAVALLLAYAAGGAA